MTTTPAPATQAAHPWRATLRTAVEVGIPAIVGLLIILPQIIQAILDGMGETMPPSLYAWLVAAAAFITALAATLARIAAIPGVVEWTRKYLAFLAPDDKPGRHEA
jgi:hypothetical protein